MPIVRLAAQISLRLADLEPADSHVDDNRVVQGFQILRVYELGGDDVPVCIPATNVENLPVRLPARQQIKVLLFRFVLRAGVIDFVACLDERLLLVLAPLHRVFMRRQRRSGYHHLLFTFVVQ